MFSIFHIFIDLIVGFEFKDVEENDRVGPDGYSCDEHVTQHSRRPRQ